MYSLLEGINQITLSADVSGCLLSLAPVPILSSILENSRYICGVIVALYTFYLIVLVSVKKLILKKHTKEMAKEGIFLLYDNIKEITVDLNEDCNFTFLTEGLDGSVEDRNIFNIIRNDGNDEFLKGKIALLHEYFDGIKKEIRDKGIPSEILSADDIDFIKNNVITYDKVKKAIEKLIKQFKGKDQSLAFIGNKVGLRDFWKEGGSIKWECYKTDHFTWKVFHELYMDDYAVETGDSTRSPHRFFISLCEKLCEHKDNNDYRKVLMHTLCYLFSSLGLDAVVIGKDCHNKYVALATVRSAKIDRSHISRIHVSVDESFSDTDLEAFQNYSVSRWLKRGIEEEIGIPIDKLGDAKITYNDFSIMMNNYGEIGLSAIVEVKGIDSWIGCPGKDKALESDGMFFIKMPGLYEILRTFPDRKFVQKHTETTHDNQFTKYPWVEFAGPIYHRTFVRRLTGGPASNTVYKIIAALILFLGILLGENSRHWLLVWVSLILAFVYLVSLFVAEWCRDRVYSRFSFWCPLWGGNVKTLMLTGKKLHGKANVNESLYMLLANDSRDGDEETKTLKTSELLVYDTPLCAVRRTLKTNDEMPISFFKITSSGIGARRLRFFVSAYSHAEQEYCLRYYVIRRLGGGNRPGIITYSFDFGLDRDYEFEFKRCPVATNEFETALGIKKEPLECYFGLETPLSRNDLICHRVPDVFNKKFQLYDMYRYKNAYYMSATLKSFDLNEEMIGSVLRNHVECSVISVCDVTKEKQNTFPEKNATKLKSYVVAAQRREASDMLAADVTEFQIDVYEIRSKSASDFEKSVNALIRRSLQRYGGLMSELDVIALQYISRRDGIIIADFKKNRWRFDNKFTRRLGELTRFIPRNTHVES